VAKRLPTLSVDLLDVSRGGNHPDQRIDGFNTKNYEVEISHRIRNGVHADDVPTGDLKLLIGAVGLITEAEQARDIVEQAGTATVTQHEDDIQGEEEVSKEMTDANGGNSLWPMLFWRLGSS
jgi:2,4-dienoyl-CoA reductase-like NADH-dependent reductase (Old Yellow Enzyme family)